MKKMLLTLLFDGSAYHGWQVQPNGITVQQTVQNALETILGERPGLTGCSRTDAGVHALEFCCHFLCDNSVPKEAFEKGLNSVLPDDIAVIECREVEDDFHARYSAKGKTYVYKILNSNKKNPFKERYSWRIERNLDTRKMQEFCNLLIGEHDFAGFSSSGRTVEDTVRMVKECKITREGDEISLRITANGFLYNMVRIIVGTAVGVSDGRITLKDVSKNLSSPERSLAGITAPAKGLFLEKVLY